MKILHIEDQFVPSLGYQLNNISRWNSIHKHQVFVISGDSKKLLERFGLSSSINELHKQDCNYFKEYGVQVYRVREYPLCSGRSFLSFRFLGLVKKINPDIIMIHALDSVTFMIALLFFNYMRKPLITDCHMVEAASLNRFRNVFRQFYRLFFTPLIKKYRIPVLALSNDTQGYIENNFKIPRKLVYKLPLGTDTSIFSKDLSKRKSCRDALRIDSDYCVFIYSGKLEKEKKVHMLVDAFCDDYFADKKIFLLIIGTVVDEYSSNIVKKLKKYSNYPFTIINNMKNTELNNYYNCADYGIFPGGCSLSFYDMQACGLPVILEDLDINKERLINGTGFLFEKDSQVALVNAINTAVGLSKKEYRSISDKSIDLIVHSYSYDKISKLLEKYMKNETLRYSSGKEF